MLIRLGGWIRILNTLQPYLSDNFADGADTPGLWCVGSKITLIPLMLDQLVLQKWSCLMGKY